MQERIISDHVASFHHFISQLDSTSVVLGLTAGMALTAIFFFLLSERRKRHQLVLSMRLEQAQKSMGQLEADTHRLRHDRDELAAECRTLDAETAALHAACKGMEQQVDERDFLLSTTKKQLEQEFQLLANEILLQKGSQINKQHESSLKMLLNPFYGQLQEFKSKVEDIYDRESRDRTSMISEIKHLKELNQRISNEAMQLTQALKGKNKLQGQWGEMVLEKILEDSGLRNGTDYQIQPGLKTDDGSSRIPDVIIHLPENRDVIIDAKVSLKAYLQTHEEKEDIIKKQFTGKHLDSIKRHVRSLAAKQYQDLVEPGNLDFVLLFIPIESAFQLAVESDPELLPQAMRNKVILVSPSTLLAVLRTIHHMWRMDEQNRNSLIIAKQAGNLYDKFVGFTEAFEDIGLRLNQSQQSWHTAKKRLTTGQGNLVSRTKALKDLGIQPNKELPDSLRKTTLS